MSKTKITGNAQDVDIRSKGLNRGGNLFKSIRKPNRSDSETLPVIQLNHQFEAPYLTKLDSAMSAPKVGQGSPLSRPKAVILDHRMPRTLTGNTNVTLRSKGDRAASREVKAEIWKHKSAPLVHACDLGGMLGGRTVTSVLFGDKMAAVNSHLYVIEPVDIAVNGQYIKTSLHSDNETKLPAPRVAQSLCSTMVRHKQRALMDSFFDHERRMIADSAGLDVREVRWIGLFRYVPIAAVQSLKVDDARGKLILILKDGASNSIAKSPKATVNIAMGRDIASGALLQVVVP